MKWIFIFLLLCFPAFLPGTTRYVQEPQREACRLWQDVEQAVWDGTIDRHEARRQFQALWPQIVVDDVPPQPEGRWQWMFPLPGYSEEDYSQESYWADNFKFYDGPVHKGHPAINIYIRDYYRKGIDDRTGKPVAVVSAAEGVVVSARKYWTASDSNPLGIYVCVLSQYEKRFFYYCYLSKLKVGLGQLVNKGQVLGWVGRTGAEVNRDHLGTHLRFQVHHFNDGLFYPVYPGRALRVASHLPWPLEKPNYGKKH